MKKLLFIVSILFIATMSFARTHLGTYYSRHFDKTFNIEADEIKKGVYSVYIQVTGQKNEEAMIELKGKHIEQFKQSMLEIRSKFIKWTKTAKENNVKEISKDLEIPIRVSSIYWYRRDWYRASGGSIKTYFMRLENRYVVGWVHDATSLSNQFIKETVGMVFTHPKEIDELVSYLDMNKITSAVDAHKAESELFN